MTESEGHGPLPAVRDLPRGYGEASWWPIIAAAGSAVLYLGIGLVILAGRDVGPGVPVGVGVTLIGAAVFVAGLGGWLYHAFVADWTNKAVHGDGGHLRWGMLIFLLTDVATFGAVYTYYLFVRAGAWPPADLPGGLLGAILAVNTVLLITSSGTFHLAEKRLQAGDHRGFRVGMAATFLLGVVFLGGQALEYSHLLDEGFALAGIYGSAFYGLTGLHGLHVALGVLMIGLVLARALRGQFSAERHTGVTTVAYYWHFVDAVWLVLVATLYVGAVIGTGQTPL
ncbi:cytochrome c oxidase subunit 3 [Halococcoides cellulosivorans]|uniref:Heme-copper oxidase subunit III n=1 Tax=Halococcoides cellulosivorans TaxID=1679096 RepID=A0A2R4X1D1_9EURY|nr:heme-copper oxidase subunit III [Halococcoides cellulosivorans]AWB27596.1 heme-copper oxidase subunit III [Halococcoides cellulosivorans]